MVHFTTGIRKPFLLIACCSTIFMVFLVVRQMGSPSAGLKADLMKCTGITGLESGGPNAHRNDPLTVVFIACKVDSDTLVNSFERQKLQLITSIKAAVYLTQRQIRIIIFGESHDVFDEVLNNVRSWPASYQTKLSFQFAQVKYEYPAKFENLKNLFRPCATLRLFLPNLLVDEDAVVYIDSDVILLRPLEEYWDNFYLFDNCQLAAAAAYVGGYRDRPQHMRYGTDGFNAGLMLFNLTRMRQFSSGWEETVRLVLDRFSNKLTFADQDVLNILFSANPSYLHLLECEWNFRNFYCNKEDLQACLKLLSEGAKAVHGAGGSFFNGGKFHSFFQTWADFSLNLPTDDLSKQLEVNLATKQKGGICENFEQIDFVMSNQLKLQKKQNLTRETHLNLE